MSDETIEPLGDKEYVGPSKEWFLRMAEAEDKSPCTSVGGLYIDMGFKFDEQRKAEYEAMMKHGALLGTVSEQQKLSQEEADYLESIKDIVADLKSDEECEGEVLGCPDPEFYEDEPDWGSMSEAELDARLKAMKEYIDAHTVEMDPTLRAKLNQIVIDRLDKTIRFGRVKCWTATIAAACIVCAAASLVFRDAFFVRSGAFAWLIISEAVLLSVGYLLNEKAIRMWGDLKELIVERREWDGV
jgi:hypothetical protein